MKQKYLNIKGFTLIEMVVVIAVIGVLMTIAFRGTSAIQGGARDAKRISALNYMSASLAEYQASEGSYPAISSACDSASAQGSSFANTNWGALAEELAKAKIIDKATDLQNDPLKSQQYCYFVNANNTEYRLTAKMERKVPNDSSKDAFLSSGCESADKNLFCLKP